MSIEENLAWLLPRFAVSPDQKKKKKRQRGGVGGWWGVGREGPEKTESIHNAEMNNTTKTLAQKPNKHWSDFTRSSWS